MIHITITNWNHTCSDGCCYTWGTSVDIDGERITNHVDNIEELLEGMMLKLGYKQDDFKIEYDN